MFSYPEFPDQVKKAFASMQERFSFELVETREDHCLIYRNSDWIIKYYCDHGAVSIYLKNLAGKKEFHLNDMLEFWFPESEQVQKLSEYIWASEATVNYQTDVLKKFFPKLAEVYPDRVNAFMESLKDEY